MHFSGTEIPRIGVLYIWCIETSLMILKVAKRSHLLLYFEVNLGKLGPVLTSINCLVRVLVVYSF